MRPLAYCASINYQFGYESGSKVDEIAPISTHAKAATKRGQPSGVLVDKVTPGFKLKMDMKNLTNVLSSLE